MKTFYGIIEDRQDPLKIGRVRVRCHGIHTDDKKLISTPDLPWAQVLLPTTSAGLSGFGTQHGLVEGTSVWGFFRDGEMCQQPVIVGVSAGIPQVGYKEGSDNALITRSVEKGFNDPRRLTVEAYNNTPDGPNPEHSPTRGFGLTTALDTAPRGFISRTFNYDATGSEIENVPITQIGMKPFYPRYTDRSDLSVLTDSSDITKLYYSQRDIPKGILTKEIKSPAEPKYPYNKVSYSESGHVLEIDDTYKAERLAVEHRSGTFHEIHPDGSQVTRIVNDNYTVVCRDDEVYIGGTVNVSIGGDAKITVGGKTDIESKGNLSVVAPQISLDGTLIKLNS